MAGGQDRWWFQICSAGAGGDEADAWITGEVGGVVPRNLN
jgi:hypothetical protein